MEAVVKDAEVKLMELHDLLDTHILHIKNWLKAYEDCDGFRRNIKILMENKLVYIESLQQVILESIK